jgi:hypothetical protein
VCISIQPWYCLYPVVWSVSLPTTIYITSSSCSTCWRIPNCSASLPQDCPRSWSTFQWLSICQRLNYVPLKRSFWSMLE